MEIKILIEELEDKVEISQKIELKDKRCKMQEDKGNLENQSRKSSV